MQPDSKLSAANISCFSAPVPYFTETEMKKTGERPGEKQVLNFEPVGLRLTTGEPLRDTKVIFPDAKRQKKDPCPAKAALQALLKGGGTSASSSSVPKPPNGGAPAERVDIQTLHQLKGITERLHGAANKTSALSAHSATVDLQKLRRALPELTKTLVQVSGVGRALTALCSGANLEEPLKREARGLRKDIMEKVRKTDYIMEKVRKTEDIMEKVRKTKLAAAPKILSSPPLPGAERPAPGRGGDGSISTNDLVEYLMKSGLSNTPAIDCYTALNLWFESEKTDGVRKKKMSEAVRSIRERLKLYQPLTSMVEKGQILAHHIFFLPESLLAGLNETECT